MFYMIMIVYEALLADMFLYNISMAVLYKMPHQPSCFLRSTLVLQLWNIMRHHELGLLQRHVSMRCLYSPIVYICGSVDLIWRGWCVSKTVCRPPHVSKESGPVSKAFTPKNHKFETRSDRSETGKFGSDQLENSTAYMYNRRERFN